MMIKWYFVSKSPYASVTTSSPSFRSTVKSEPFGSSS